MWFLNPDGPFARGGSWTTLKTKFARHSLQDQVYCNHICQGSGTEDAGGCLPRDGPRYASTGSGLKDWCPPRSDLTVAHTSLDWACRLGT